MHKDINVLREHMGHRGNGLIARNYKRTVDIAEAERFCSIFPPKQEQLKIVGFPVAS
jgi:hypothetical protein